MSEWKNIIVHCSDSEWGCAREVRKWHIEKGWRDIGYHFVIQNGFPVKDFYIPVTDGALECGRDLDGDGVVEDNEVGAHALGMNNDSIGICMIGNLEPNFTPGQFKTLAELVVFLMKRFGISIDNVLGHYETAQANGKTCPNFDMRGFREVMKYHLYKKGEL